jgi:DNA-binding NarL/FixJ family response regulator
MRGGAVREDATAQAAEDLSFLAERLNGIEAAVRIRQNSPNSRVVFVTLDGDAEVRNVAFHSGAKGYVPKVKAATELLPAIEAALRDGPTSLDNRLYRVRC